MAETSLVPLIAANITDGDLKELELCFERNARAKSRPKQLEWFSTERSVIYLSKVAKEREATIREHERIVQTCRERDLKKLQEALEAQLKIFHNFRID